MRDIFSDVEHWRTEASPVALATVVKVSGSAPRPLGSKMAVSSAGEMVGSVSGGCVEGAVYEEARSAMQTGRPKLLRFGISDEQAWGVGLMCGGEIEVFVEPLSGSVCTMAEIYQELKRSLGAEEPVALATVLTGRRIGAKLLFRPGGESLGDLGDVTLSERVQALSAERLAKQSAERVVVEAGGESVEVFIDVHPPSPKLVIVGAVHIAIPLVSFARLLGFRTIVVDPRAVFATPGRFAHADEILLKWPQEAFEELALNESTYIVVLSHDSKFDLPALKLALGSSARYVGAIGSRKTHLKRLAALRELGVSEEQLRELRSPIGLNLGGRRAEEIALSIIAEIVAARSGVEPGRTVPMSRS